MPRIRYVLAADSINQSATGKISILGIFDVVFANEMPANTSFDFIACFEGDVKDDKKDYGVRVWGAAPGEKKTVIVDDPSGIRFSEREKRKEQIDYSCVFRVGTLPLKEFGTIQIVVELLEEDESSLEIRKVLDSVTLNIPVVPLADSDSSTITEA